jgi:RNA polymerase sigma factor (sigma-70 family)
MRTVSLQISDDLLVANYISGNEKALEQLINRHKGKIFAHIYNIVKNADLADDVFQETFIKAIDYLKTGKYNEEGKFSPWVMRIAHNLSIDYIRKRKKSMIQETVFQDFDLMNLLSVSTPSREDQIIEDQMRSKLNQLMGQLPDDQKDIVYLRHYAGLSFKEIAEEKNISINTALGRMRYALINLRKLIKDQELVFAFS